MQKLISLFTATFMLFVLVSTKNAMSAPLSFETDVSGENTKPAVILIPGLMSNGQVFEELAIKLSANYYVHVLSVKGFAGTPAMSSKTGSNAAQTAEFSLHQFTQDIVTYIDSEKLDKPIIIGHSMGGLSAFNLASKHQDKINSVISIDGLPFIGPIFTRTNQTTVDMLAPQAKSIKSMYQNMSSEQIAAQTQQGVFIQATAQADQARVIEMAKTSNPHTVANAMYDVMTTDLREQMSQITIPMLMLGASGAFTHDAQHQQVAGIYQAQFADAASATVIMNKEIRHFMMFDDIDWVYNTVIEFLGE
jgi:pimeloyl-ACP methyl ester carboxylesterase